MEQYFYIFCFLSLVIVVSVSIFLILNIKKELDFYRQFSGNEEKRALLAKDSKRFHISIVYLMTYMTRANGNNVQLAQLNIISRYIEEIIPLEYQVEAMETLKYLTDREKSSGKTTYHESIVDVKAFKKGLFYLRSGDNSYYYSNSIHGTKMAEELSRYLSKEECLYIMYLLFRLAIADDVITTDGEKPEIDMLEKLCVKGLKLDKTDLDDLINHFKNNKHREWYNKNFANKKDIYPSFDLFANIFHVDIDELASLNNKKISSNSYLFRIKTALAISTLILGLSLFANIIMFQDLINLIYGKFIFFLGGIVTFIMFFASLFIEDLDSSKLPVLRTEYENKLQKEGLIVSIILSVITGFGLYFSVPNLLLLIGNNTFVSDHTLSVTMPIQDRYTVSHKNTTSYYVSFPNLSLESMDTPKYVRGKRISYYNSICLKTLYYLSGMCFWGANKYEILNSQSISDSDYLHAPEMNIRLYFELGYFGMYKLKYSHLTKEPVSKPDHFDGFGEEQDDKKNSMDNTIIE